MASVHAIFVLVLAISAPPFAGVMTLRADGLDLFVVLWRIAKMMVVLVPAGAWTPCVTAIDAEEIVRVRDELLFDEVVDAPPRLARIAAARRGELSAPRNRRLRLVPATRRRSPPVSATRKQAVVTTVVAPECCD